MAGRTKMYFRQLLDKIDQYREKRDVFHDLMKFKVEEVLLVATLYDSFIIEQEGELGDVVYGEYHQLNLSSAPRITSAYSAKSALRKLQHKKFDMVIVMVGVEFSVPKELSLRIKELAPDIPITLLFNNNSTFSAFSERYQTYDYADQAFVWNGDPTVFLAMIKLVEDRRNIDNDTRLGMVRVILLVEDSVRYYSRYLPVLYSEIMKQTRRLIESEESDSRKLLRMRARPKVVVASNYEDAVELFETYKDNMLCVISDVHYKKNGKGDKEAGIRFMEYVREKNRLIPILLQSSDAENREKAEQLNAFFMNKKSDSFATELRHFILSNLGFGKFVFKSGDGLRVIAEANNMEEFEKEIRKLPKESLLYHAEHNHFSTWLMARGEVQLATILRTVSISHFDDYEMLREFLIEIFDVIKQLKTRGLVIGFEQTYGESCNCIFRLATGSLGGKGRGVAFINNLIERVNFGIDRVDIKIPLSGIIGSDAFDEFIEINDFSDYIHTEDNYQNLRKRFLDAHLPDDLQRKLRKFIKNVNGPLAVRSSGLFEDMLMQPFAGIYETYFLPNSSSTEEEVRFKQLSDAVKLIYASIYSPKAKSYFNALNYEIEEEKMAVVIQKVVGRRHDNYFYPHISGTAQSRNHYPVAYLKSEDGISVIAAGLGTYVVDGDNAFRFCAKYPRLDLISESYQVKNTQQYLYAIDLNNKLPDILEGENNCYTKLPIEKAKKHGTMRHILSYLDYNDNRVYPGVSETGIDIVNYSNILKYGVLPLPEAVQAFLEVGEKSMGTPVEIEFAFDIDDKNDSGTFYVLQLKPMIHLTDDAEINIEEIKKEETLLFTDKGMGNGVISDVCDIVFIDPEKFDKTATRSMVDQIDQLNKMFCEEHKRYILIGPGRWGSRDPYLGIPVNFSNISNSKIIVEAGLKDFQIDASLGSHFFHNIVSMNIGYFTVNYQSKDSFIDWEWLKSLKPHEKTEHFVHVRLENPVEILMDGRKGISVIKKLRKGDI